MRLHDYFYLWYILLIILYFYVSNILHVAQYFCMLVLILLLR